MDIETSKAVKECKKEIEKLNYNSKQLKILTNNALKVMSQPHIQVAVQTMKNFSNEYSNLAVKNYVSAISNNVLPEITKAIIGSDYLVQIINNTSIAMQELVKNSLNANVENIANALKVPLLQSIPDFKLQINEIINNLPEIQPSYLALNKLNFSKYVWSEMPSEEFTDELINTSDIDKTVNKFASKIDLDIIEKCYSTEYVKTKRTLFSEIIDNYKKGNYYTAVVCLTSLIDGFMSYMTDLKTSKFPIRKSNILKKIQDNKKIINEDSELFVLAMTSECMLNTFFTFVDFNDKEPDLINRHWIMHCQSEKEYTEYEFKKILLFLYGLIRIDELSCK